MVAPSDMNDGRIGVIKEKLFENSLDTKVDFRCVNIFSFKAVLSQHLSVLNWKVASSFNNVNDNRDGCLTCSAGSTKKRELPEYVEIFGYQRWARLLHEILAGTTWDSSNFWLT